MAAIKIANTTIHSCLSLLVSTNSDKLIVRETTLVASDPEYTDTSVGTGSTGDTAIGTWRMTLPEFRLTADIICLIRWEIQVVGGQESTGRINANLKREGSAISGVSEVNGTTTALNATGSHEETFSFRVDGEEFTEGDRLDLILEFEVVNAAAGTATIRLHHKPGTATASCMEINI